jgi:very-short-patch-repair endonuclease
MTTPEAHQEKPEVEVETCEPVRVEIEADRTIGYVSIQNSVPVIRSVRVTNKSLGELQAIQVLVRCNPAFAKGAHIRFDRLRPDETRTISPIDLQPDHSYLAGLQEGLVASLTVTVVEADKELLQVTRDVQVLAYDQWAGTRALPELLAAFSMPNNPAIDILVGKASKLLRKSNPELSMNGYQSKSRDVVWKQVSAVYSTIAAESLQYAEPPASFGSDGQKIRTPDRILETRVATCLDLALLFASTLEQAGLRAVILMKQGHAWVGVWLHEASFTLPLTDDVQAVRKRVSTGEFLVFETTGVAQHHSHRPSLRIAVEQGQRHLQEEEAFLYAVDIHMARGVQIKPLPSKVAPVRREEHAQEEVPEDIEPTPVLPPLDPEFLKPLDLPAGETPEGRLAKWKSKLLDLTLRNRLLNFKPTKTTLQLVAPDLGAVEDNLVLGQDFTLKSLPNLMDGNDPRSAQVHAGRTGRSPLDDMAAESLANKELIARASAEALDASLLALFSAARTGFEEGGANTLYLALGMLKWSEVKGAESSHLAPILLVPVSLTRQSVRSGFRLCRHDDEAIVNPTLLQLLKNAYELAVPGLDAALPTDERGVDVPRILQAFRIAVREIAGWEVLEQAHLGIFSFTKYLMWKDLQDRTEQLKNNRVVKHLIENPGQAFAVDSGEYRERRLDDYKPQDILAPKLADSSQLLALCAVDAERDLVLEGPPGTGKSQTITNLIAHTLAKGKTVLFVSEKMAALEVVHRRLAEIGLGPFCLELHSAKASKAGVLQQLGAALAVSGARTVADWNREAERLAALRQELNALVTSLHKEHQTGLTVFEAIGTCIANTGGRAAEMPWASAQTHSEEELDKLRETARRISALAQALPALSGHPLALVGRTEWSPSWQDDLLAGAGGLSAAAGELKSRSEPLGKLLNLAVAGGSVHAFTAVDELAQVLLAAPKVPAGFAKQAHDAATRARVLALAKHGRARQHHWAEVGLGWAPALAKLNATELKGEWTQAKNSWWLKAWFAKHSVLSRLAAVREDGKPPAAETLEKALSPLAEVNEEDQYLRSAQAEAEALLQETYEGIATDWQAVDSHAAWAKSFSDSLSKVADALAGTDPSALEAVRQKVTPLVGEQRAMLSPSGLVGGSLLAFRDAHREFFAKLEQVRELAAPASPLVGPAGSDGVIERVRMTMEHWAQGKKALQPWCLWRAAREHAIAQGLQGVVTIVESGEVPLADVEKRFEYSYQSWWLKKTVDVDPVLRGFSSSDHQRKIREFRVADAKFQQLTQDYIAAKLAGSVPSASSAVVSADSEMGRLRRELQKQKRHMPVRQLVQGLPTLLPKLKPCLLMSPLSVAQYLDARYAQFDLVVFDEASQIPVWDAVGVIARGRQLVVVGDPKQLPPTSFFNRSSDQDSNAPATEEQVDDLESILDECLGAGMNRMSLKWHYRSKHESLITFSNIRYYDSELITFPSPVTADTAVRFQQVNGVYDRGGSRTNRAEAEAIVKGIEQHYTAEGPKGRSLGVVTFNQTQQSLIETLLDARRRANAKLDRVLAEALAEPLFIKNLENVQGDERDVIYFSITYGPDAAGRMSMNFGPLNGEGGHRRLNVAISRARDAVVVFSTLKPEQIDLSRVRAAGVRDLKHYLEFAIRGPRALVEQSAPTGADPDSPFEVAVMKMLRDKGWVVHPQVGCSGYRIDMAVVDPRAPGRYLVGVECDGRSYHSAASARDRDRLRQHVLEGLGWKIHRIWSTDWWLNAEAELEKMQAVLNGLLEEAVGVESATEVDGPDEDVETHDQVAAEPAAQEQGTPVAPAKSLPAYIPIKVSGGEPAKFYEPGTNLHLQRALIEVISSEGPILDAVLYKKVARAWGLERTGSRIVERLRSMVPSTVVATKEADKTFYWPPGSSPDSWLQFRIAASDDSSKRHVDEVPLEEIGALVAHVLEEAGSSTRQDVARTTCRLLGMARTPADAEARVAAAIDRLIESNALIEDGAYLRRPRESGG